MISDYRLLIVVMLFMILLSTFLHMPSPFGNPSMYSDINSIYTDLFIGKKKIEEGGRWYVEPRDFAIPYIHYKFEYPPIIGFTWLITTSISNVLSENDDEKVLCNYLFQSLIILYAALLLVTDVYGIAQKLKLRWQAIYLIAMPSLVLFATYNWDLIAIAFAIRSLFYLLIKKDSFRGGIFAGLALASKIIPGVIILPIVLELYFTRRFKDGTKFMSGALIGGLIPYMLILMAAPRGFHDFISHHASWYLENSWYVMFTDNIWSEGLRSLSQALVALSIFIFSFLPIKGIYENRILVKSWLVTAGFILFNYVYTPQMNLILLPYLALLAPSEPLMIYSFDFLNGLIILLWFSLSYWCSLLGISCEGGPWVRTSPTQWIAFIRCLLLGLILYQTLRIWVSRKAILKRGRFEEVELA